MAKRKQKQKQKQKDVISRLAETGEEALHKIVELPGGTRVVEAANALRERVDELTKRVRSLDPLERRVAELEKQLNALTKPPPKAKPTTARKKPAASTARKPAKPKT